MKEISVSGTVNSFQHQLAPATSICHVREQKKKKCVSVFVNVLVHFGVCLSVLRKKDGPHLSLNHTDSDECLC